MKHIYEIETFVNEALDPELENKLLDILTYFSDNGQTPRVMNPQLIFKKYGLEKMSKKYVDVMKKLKYIKEPKKIKKLRYFQWIYDGEPDKSLAHAILDELKISY